MFFLICFLLSHVCLLSLSQYLSLCCVLPLNPHDFSKTVTGFQIQSSTGGCTGGWKEKSLESKRWKEARHDVLGAMFLGGKLFYLQLELFCLQLSFFAYSPLRPLLEALSHCKQKSSNCKQQSQNCKQKKLQL